MVSSFYLHQLIWAGFSMRFQIIWLINNNIWLTKPQNNRLALFSLSCCQFVIVIDTYKNRDELAKFHCTHTHYTWHTHTHTNSACLSFSYPYRIQIQILVIITFRISYAIAWKSFRPIPSPTPTVATGLRVLAPLLISWKQYFNSNFTCFLCFLEL